MHAALHAHLHSTIPAAEPIVYCLLVVLTAEIRMHLSLKCDVLFYDIPTNGEFSCPAYALLIWELARRWVDLDALLGGLSISWRGGVSIVIP